MTNLRTAFAAAWSALRFWLLNFPAMLRLTWFPFALVGLTGYGWAYWNAAVEIAQVQNQGATTVFLMPTPNEFGATIFWALLQLIALAAAAVAVHRLVIANERREGEFFAFAFGRAERAYFAMGLVAYALAWTLLAGQYLAQFAMPPLDESLVSFIAVTYGTLGQWGLSLLLMPGEVEIFSMSPLNYALWCALVIATGAVLLRIAPWPAAIADTQSLALGRTLAVTRGRTASILGFALALAVALLLIMAIAGAAGVSSLLFAGPEGIGQLFKSTVDSGNGPPPTEDFAVQMALNLRSLAFYQEVARFVTNVVGVTLGATLVSHLYLLLTRDR